MFSVLYFTNIVNNFFTKSYELQRTYNEPTISELKRHLKKYLDLLERESVYVTRRGEVVAVLSAPHEERVKIIESLFGCIPADITLEESREERLSRI